MATFFAINLGGEGEIPGVLNQQEGPWVLLPSWFSSQTGKSLVELVADGHQFLIARNTNLPLPDAVVDIVFTNSVPIDITTPRGPGVQSSEIERILKSGGRWFHDD